MEDVVIKLKGKSDVLPHLFSKHGPARTREELVKSIFEDWDAVKARVEEKEGSSVKIFNEAKEEFVSEINTICSEGENTSLLQNPILSNFCTNPNEENYIGLMNYIKENMRGTSLGQSLRKHLLDYGAPLKRLGTEAEFFGIDPKQRGLDWWLKAKKKVNLSVIQYKASKFKDETQMKAKIENVLASKQDEIDRLLTGKKIGDTCEISEEIDETENSFFSGVTFDQQMEPVDIHHFSKIYIILMNYKKGSSTLSNGEGTGRYIIKTAYPQT